MRPSRLWRGFLLLLLMASLTACYVPKRGGPETIKTDGEEQKKITGEEIAKQTVTQYRGSKWVQFNDKSWTSDAHDRMLVDVYGNRASLATYGSASEARRGSTLVMHSWISSQKIATGPVWIMVKMERGYDTDYGDWYYAQVGANGNVLRAGSSEDSGIKKCASCHAEVMDHDYLFGIPDAAKKRDGMYWRRNTEAENNR